MKWLAQICLLELAKLVAPVVTLFYRKGIWVTPDDPVSPYGVGNAGSDEPFMRKMYDKFPAWVGDWWWLGVRNRAYGLAYKFKPDVFKVTTYENIVFTEINEQYFRKIMACDVDEDVPYTEYLIRGPFFHIICGYRLRPMLETAETGQPVRPINMDARPILTIRFGRNDD